MGLESAGFTVQSATNGADCLLRLSEEVPDFIVTDIEMPEMSGKELCFVIEKQFPSRKFPIVVLTSHTEGERRDWTSDFPNLEIMEKPVSIVRPLKHINDCLGSPV